MSVDDKLFEQVPLNLNLPNPCSPAEPRLPWLGLVIQAPRQVGFRPGRPVDGHFARIPVCGFYRLELASLLDGKPLTLVAVSLKDQRRHSAAVLDEEPGSVEPHPDAVPLDPNSLKGMSTASYFNPNLARYVDLPAEEAVYEVHAEYGGKRSNSVRIAVVWR